MKAKERSCFTCGQPIAECMGFVIVRDFLKMVGDTTIINPPREICGRCGLIALESPQNLYTKLNATSL